MARSGVSACEVAKRLGKCWMYSFIVGCQNELKWNFFDGHFWRAMFESDAIRADKDAGAIGAQPTMNKDRWLPGAQQSRRKIRPSVHR